MTLPMRISLSSAACSARCCDIAPSEARAAIRTNSTFPVTRMLDTLSLAPNEVGSIRTQGG